MYYAKQKIYETPLFDVVAVSTETGFATSDPSLMNSTEGTDDTSKWNFVE